MSTIDSLIAGSAVLPALLGLWLKSGMLLGAAFLLVKWRRWSAEERHLVIVAALFAASLLPATSAITPNLPIAVGFWGSGGDRVSDAGDITRSPGLAPGASTDSARISEVLPREAALDLSSRIAVESPRDFKRQPIDLGLALVGLYGLIATILFAYFGHSALRISRLTRSLGPVEDEATRVLVDALRMRLGIARRVRILAGTSGHTPWAWGAFRPVVVLPLAFPQWPAEQQRDALVHELSHIKRLDLLTSLVGCACAALCWPQPLAWRALRAMTREAENACDDRVLLTGAGNSAYAAQLLEIANHIYLAGTTERSNPLVVAMASRSAVARRIRSILDSRTRRDTVNTSKLVVVTVTSLGIVGLLSGLTISHSQEVSGGDAAGQLNDPEFQTLVSNGPKSDEDLQRLVETFIANDRQADATRAFIDYVSRSEPGNTVCAYCTSLLLTDAAVLETDAIHAALRSAFGALEQKAYATNDGKLLFRLAWISINSTNREAVARGAWYLFEAQRIGNTAKPDAVKMLAVRALAQLGRLEDAKSLAEELYSDPSSKYYQSASIRGWTTYFDREMGRTSALSARLLSVDEHRPVTEQNYLPVYKVAPRYPETAAKQGKEGNVVVEFTVNSRGRTENVFVVQSTDVMFENAALEAAREFLYMPKIVNGTAVDQPGVKNKITFVMTP
jgi:TonB family protein